ncbi:MAG: hypothetical protein JW912_07555 [Sedimentisphaerales bacterium]|nr:hypothetical protein [Sedimentisphaerales bacterium]
MGIKVAHEIDGSVLGDAAYGAGQAQGSERRREQDRDYQLQQQVNAIREKARKDANARFFAQLQAQMQAQDQELEFKQKQYDQLPDRQRQLGEIQNDLKKDLAEWEFSKAQQQQLAKIAQARNYITGNADGRYTPEEQKVLLRQVDEAEYGIKPVQRKQLPWPKQQDVGQIWIDQNSGATLTRDDNGNVKMLVKPDDTGSFTNRLKLKETIAKHAKDLYETHQMMENPLSWEDAVKQAESFYSDLIEPSSQQQQPVGNEETMADQILRQVMSPETYAAAKQTGLPSTDIYYIVQQLTAKTGKNNSKSGISKKDWMAKGDNFHSYREGFADSVPGSQIEEAYLNDPFIKSNNSKLADKDHNPTTPLAVWEELTDYQRDLAYKKYLKANKQPLADRIGMKVTKLISKADYENYKQKQAKHKAKLLTKDQFIEKVKNDPEFLWKYIRVRNKPETIRTDSNTIDSHRAIDSYRRPVFGGLR